MRLHLNDIERMNICPVLYRNKWDYSSNNNQENAAFIFGMKEIFKWNYRRKKSIDLSSFLGAFSYYCSKNNIELNDKIALEKEFKFFINDDFYLNFNNVFINYKTDIIFNKNKDVLEYEIPLIITKGKTVYLSFYTLGNIPNSMILNRYDVWYSAMWCFYVLNKTPKILNFYYNKGKINKNIITIKDDYIIKAKSNLIKLGEKIQQNSLPPVEICKNCSNIFQCERFTEGKK